MKNKVGVIILNFYEYKEQLENINGSIENIDEVISDYFTELVTSKAITHEMVNILNEAEEQLREEFC